MRKSLLCFLAANLITSSHAYAGFHELTWHSRANCMRINESITWHFGHSYMLSTISTHLRGNNQHDMKTGWVNTWRSADVHWTEGDGLWWVTGKHYIMEGTNVRLLGTTDTYNCDIYDGWWDQDKPRAAMIEQQQPEFFSDTEKLPGPGIHIVKSSDIGLPKELLIASNDRINQMKYNGYIEKDSQDARELLTLGKQNYRYDDKSVRDDMRHNREAIKTAWDFNKVVTENIGFAPAGTYIKDKGWTAIAEYFKDPQMGVCDLLVDNISLSHGGINLREDTISYDVNNHPSVKTIEGNENSGYVYILSWYDNTFIRTLKCARKDYDKDVMDKMIKFASDIDD
jgi:hypothetical protein